ncbi:TIGR04222 domain-containing membrane protein [Actinomadura madurae]
MEEIDPYEMAYLCGGPRRVVETAIFVLYRQRRVRVSRGTHRIDVVVREANDPSPVLRVAMMGPAGIEEARMREILESDD